MEVDDENRKRGKQSKSHALIERLRKFVAVMTKPPPLPRFRSN
jgi:hypothetical protein